MTFLAELCVICVVGGFFQEKFIHSLNAMIIYRMVIVEGRCDQLTLSSLHTYIIIGWHKSIVSSDWSDTLVWFGQILLLLYFYHPIYMILGLHAWLWLCLLLSTQHEIWLNLIKSEASIDRTARMTSISTQLIRCCRQIKDHQPRKNTFILNSWMPAWSKRVDWGVNSWNKKVLHKCERRATFVVRNRI